MNSHTLTFSNKIATYQILQNLKVDVNIQENDFNLSLDDLFTMAARINKKRSFLFISKVLGKHIPINPTRGLLTGTLLAFRYHDKVNRQKNPNIEKELLSCFINDKNTSASLEPFIEEHYNPIIIGFAETATSLGYAFFNSFSGADYFHTTREDIKNLTPAITFEEEHSHATAHRCYISETLLQNNRDIILVDDEITTGKTAINIIKSIHQKYPRKNYTVVSILDWRSEDHIQKFSELEKELNIVIHSVNLLKGNIHVEGNNDEILGKQEVTEQKLPQESRQSITYINVGEFPINTIRVDNVKEQKGYIKETGRFGLNAEENAVGNEWLSETGKELTKWRAAKNTLCLGTGEFMYIPMKLASIMGDGVYYQSTTRSPIFVMEKEMYGAQYGLVFQNPEDVNISNHVYNIPPNHYDELFLFFEKEVSSEDIQPMLNELKRTNIKDIKIVTFTKGNGDFVHE